MRLGRLLPPATPKRSILASFLLLALLLSTQSLTAGLGEPVAVDDLPGDPLEWLALVELLITEEESSVFLSLRHDYQRQAFIELFWSERDPFPETSRNEFLETWQHRLELAAEQFGNHQEDRAESLLLAGPPEEILADLCPQLLGPHEIWLFEASSRLPRPFSLVFVQGRETTEGTSVRWSPSEGLGALSSGPEESRLDTDQARTRWSRHCSRGKELFDALDAAVDWQALRAEVELVPEPTDGWAEEFLSRSIGSSSPDSSLEGRIEFTFPGRRRHQTILQGLITIPLARASLSEAGSEPVYSFLVRGEVVKDDRLLESFRYRFDLPAADISGDVIPLAFQRYLRPQPYQIAIRVEDLNSSRCFREERNIRVPAITRARLGSISGAAEPSGPFAESDVALGSEDHSLKIVTPSNELHTDRLRVEAIALGDSVAKVTFVLNGRPVLSKTRPPFSVEIDLGGSPRLHTLEAMAMDENGSLLARDRIPINAGPHRFAVRLLEPQPGQRFVNSLRAVAAVDVPRGETLDRVDFYLNEDRLASLYQPPFAQPLALPQRQRITYVRAVAYLRDGNSTEDLVFINSPPQMDHLRINFVELYTTVTERGGSPVEGLQREEFQVFEEGVPQQIRRFERVRDLPIHTGILLDTSTSMLEELSEAVEAALRFFEAVVRPRDRASVVVFNDEPRLEVPFTSNHQILAGGLVDLEAEGETALFDSLVFALHYFSGIKGKRALIVLSDGEDSSSRYSFEETLEFARRSGVAIYTIGLGLPSREPSARMRLLRFAEDTGGRHFSIGQASELTGIYQSIEEELHFQYLLAYQSANSEGDAFRRVEVEVAQPGLEAKTVPGYYP